MQLKPAPVRTGLHVGDRVKSIGIISNGFGRGNIIEIDRNVATVQFESNLAIETFHVAMLTKVSA